MESLGEGPRSSGETGTGNRTGRDAHNDLDHSGPFGHGDRVRRLLPSRPAAATLAAISRPPDGTAAAGTRFNSKICSLSFRLKNSLRFLIEYFT